MQLFKALDGCLFFAIHRNNRLFFGLQFTQSFVRHDVITALSWRQFFFGKHALRGQLFTATCLFNITGQQLATAIVNPLNQSLDCRCLSLLQQALFLALQEGIVITQRHLRLGFLLLPLLRQHAGHITAGGGRLQLGCQISTSERRLGGIGLWRRQIFGCHKLIAVLSWRQFLFTKHTLLGHRCVFTSALNIARQNLYGFVINPLQQCFDFWRLRLFQ